MIKYNKLKPIVIDKERHLLDINNWTLLSEDWCDLDYTKKYYNFELEWEVNGQTIITEIELIHNFKIQHCGGDYWTPPSTDIVSDEVEVYAPKMSNYDTGFEYDTYNDRTIVDLLFRLEHFIEDEYF
jgi:hypothetical protein